jgi:abequosyltransferase
MNATSLTIAIPTYNRSKYLDFLLSVLAREVKDLGGRVRVFVSDNASSDDTSSVVERHRQSFPELVAHRNEENVGPDRNIESCFARCDSTYAWIMGDDDVPLPGAIAQLLEMLESERPDMIYLPSVGSDDVARDQPRRIRFEASWRRLSRERFASAVNVQFTFISGLVVRKAAASSASIDAALCHTRESKLVQLAWTFETLNQGERFILASTPMLMATAGNSGGYGVLEVFLVNHTLIAQELLARRPDLVRRILARTSSCFVPGLIWNIRNNRMGRFELPSVNEVHVPLALARLVSFRLLVRPIWGLPTTTAMLFFQVSRVVARLARTFDNLIVKLGTERVPPTRSMSP